MKKLMHIILLAVGTILLFCNPLQGQQVEPDSLLTISELKKTLYNKDASADSNKVYKTSGIANISSGQLHETYLQIFIQNDSVGVSLFGYEIDIPVSSGDSVVVSGTRQMYHGEPELRISRYNVYPKDSMSIEPIDLSKVIENPGEYTGMLVEGSGIIQEKGNQFNGRYLMVAESDTSEKAIMVYVSNYHSQYQEFDFDTPGVGDEVRLKGVLGKYDPTYPKRMQYKILLRNADDFSHNGWPQYYFEYLAWVLGALILVSAGWTFSLRRQVKRKTNALQESLEEKEVLLQEIHHRVKNNLASISGILELQAGTSDSEEVQEVLRESQTRIKSMVMIHEKLYQSISDEHINMQAYLKELAESIRKTVAPNSSNIDIRVTNDATGLDKEQVIPLGLLVNELLVNAFKHAFNNKQHGIIFIELSQNKQIITLKVEDNGVGLPEKLESTRGDSLGMILIDVFTRQLNARKTVVNNPGASFVFTFPETVSS